MTAAAPAPRPRRYRSLPEKLGSVVLAFEAVVVFLAGLAVFGLRALPDQVAPWWAIAAGALVAIAMLLTSGMLRHRWGIVAGWALQALTAVGALFVPAILLVTVVFGAMWAYATIGGARIEKRAAANGGASG